jgi:hypothetical protein
MVGWRFYGNTNVVVENHVDLPGVTEAGERQKPKPAQGAGFFI